jgi:hypothetical protein
MYTTRSRAINSKLSRKRKTNYKTKSKRIMKINQSGGVNTIQEFIDELLKRYNRVELPKDFKYDKPKENTYYLQLLKILPCASRLRDARIHKKRDLVRYKFKSDLVKNGEEILIQDEVFFGEHDTIVCSKLSGEEDGYQITMVKFNNEDNICDIQVQLIALKSVIPDNTGHALILLINNKEKTFSVIDPNGGGTLVDNDLNDYKLSIMLEQCIPGYEKKPIEFPPCQMVSTFPNSCLVWSQLFIELILRFGLENTKTYFDSVIKYAPGHQYVIAQRMTTNANFARNVATTQSVMNSIIKCFVIYIKSCMDDKTGDTWIYPPEYIAARDLRSKISDIAKFIQKLDLYKNRQRGEYIFFSYDKFLITIDSNWNWILCFNIEQKYVIKSNEFDQQYLATLLAKFENFKQLAQYLYKTQMDNMLFLTKQTSDPIVQYLFPKKGYLS